MAPQSRSVHRGSLKLVLAFDIGTTYSGVAYAFLDPGQVPSIEHVQSYPCQEHVGGNHSKIPTIILYDQNGRARAVGAEAVHARTNNSPAEQENWTEAKLFKLHLRPSSMPILNASETIKPLPPNKTVIDLFADMIRYLYLRTRVYLEETGALRMRGTTWSRLEQSSAIEFVLTHPNGWGGPQQDQMRRAAIQANLVSNLVVDRARVRFVTEGEASLNFCIDQGFSGVAVNDGILIIDAGGGTVDMNIYRRRNVAGNLSFEEIAPPECLFQGSEFVTGRAQAHFTRLFQGSRYSGYIEYMASLFDKGPKLTFRYRDEASRIVIGSNQENNAQYGIQGGKLVLSGANMASFFEPSIAAIKKAILEQKQMSCARISAAFLVGGFAANHWLFNQIQEFLQAQGITLYRPGRGTFQKEVAAGGVSYRIDHFVNTRVSKYAYGIDCSLLYDSTDQEHIRRASQKFIDASGETRIRGAFDVILQRNVQVSEAQEFRSSYYQVYEQMSAFPNEFRASIKGYRGPHIPKWGDVDTPNYFTLCDVVVDSAKLRSSVTSKYKTNRYQVYYEIAFDIILNFGMAELTAQVCWKQYGVETRFSPLSYYSFR